MTSVVGKSSACKEAGAKGAPPGPKPRWVPTAVALSMALGSAKPVVPPV